MASYRQSKLNEQLANELAQIVREIKDPRVSGALVSITRAECAADLKTAKVFYSSVGGDPDAVAKGLASAHGFIRSAVASRLNMRMTPTMKFVRDGSIERGERIASLLREAGVSDPVGGADADVDEGTVNDGGEENIEDAVAELMEEDE